MRNAILVGLTTLLFGPATCLIGMAVLLNPAAQASCLTTAGMTIGTVPDHLAVTTGNGTRFTLTRTQLTHAATIIKTGGRTAGIGRDGVIVALMAALTESTLRMLSNTAASPESASYPNDGNGGDHDSLGLFQMRPSTGWGSVANLMDPSYQARAFFGGSKGPNHGSPRGLLDIPGWQRLPKGAAAQAVEVSAYPDRYANFEPAAETILTALTRGPSSSTGASAGVPETARVVFPLPTGTWVRTSGFGIRVHPITGVHKLHTGVDFAASSGTPILAAADGRVAFAGPATGYGNLILIEHTVNGQRVATGYAHMTSASILVRSGDIVTAGQHIAGVGSTGYATGPHLHFEVRPGGANAAPVDHRAVAGRSGRSRSRRCGRRRERRLRTGRRGDALRRQQPPASSSTIRPRKGRSPPALLMSLRRFGLSSPRPHGPATRPEPAKTRSTLSAGPATAPSATRSVTPPPGQRSTWAGGRPTG